MGVRFEIVALCLLVVWFVALGLISVLIQFLIFKGYLAGKKK